MKKNDRKLSLVYMVIMMNLIIMTGCNSDNTTKGNTDAPEVEMATENKKEEISDTKTEDQEEVSGDGYVQCKSYSYSIAPSELVNKDLDRPEDNSEWTKSLEIKYPQIYNLEDTEKQEKINDLLFKKITTQYNILENRDYIEYFSDYKITYADDERFSVLITGTVSDYRSSNRFAFAMTIDIANGEEISLEKVFEVNESFVENCLFSEFNVVDNNFEDISDNVPYVEQYVETYANNTHTNDFYVKEDGLGIIIPTHDSMGYILIEGNTQ